MVNVIFGPKSSAAKKKGVLSPKLPYEGLKWLWEWFLAIFEIKKNLTLFVLGESRNAEFFFKILKIQNVLQVAILNIFWRDRA